MIRKTWLTHSHKHEGVHHDHITVIKALDERDKRNALYYLCKCDCGKEFKVVSDRIYKIKSCGCMRNKMIGEGNTKHGGSCSRLYAIWTNMKSRCYSPNNKSYKDYGGRGIEVCDEWRDSFSAFREWAIQTNYDETAMYGDCTLDRINVDGNYEPDNCRWVSEKVQQNNRRDNNRITFNGETHTLSEWSHITGITQNTLSARLRHGWDIEKTLTMPQKEIVYLEYQGVRKRLTAWAKELGISRNILGARRRAGWTDKEIIEGVLNK